MEPKTITVQEISQKGNRIKIVDTNNVSYSFFTDKKDGDATKAYKDYMLFKPQTGDVLQIMVKESEGEFQGKAVTYRNIMSMNRDVLAEPKKTSYTPEDIQNEFNSEPTVNVVTPEDEQRWENAKLCASHMVSGGDILEFRKLADQIYKMKP